MNAYVNFHGDVLAVFVSDRGGYAVFMRKAGELAFKSANRYVFPIRKTRAAAEQDMHIYARDRSYNSWEFVENWKG